MHRKSQSKQNIADLVQACNKAEPGRLARTLGQKIIAHRHKLRDEQGISTYVSSGRKTHYLKCKEKQLACINYLCGSKGQERYNNYCLRCFVHLFPDNTTVRRYKSKEMHVVNFIKASFPDVNICLDKRVDGGCSRFRPDILIDCLTHSVIVEVDENQHDTYDCTCENKRMMTLFEDLGSRPLVLIRFNPDDYIDHNGRHIPSSFVYDSNMGLPKIRKQYEWNNRLTTFKNATACHLEQIPEQEVTIVHLYYDGFNNS